MIAPRSEDLSQKRTVISTDKVRKAGETPDGLGPSSAQKRFVNKRELKSVEPAQINLRKKSIDKDSPIPAQRVSNRLTLKKSDNNVVITPIKVRPRKSKSELGDVS
jgi:hypothetical protein